MQTNQLVVQLIGVLRPDERRQIVLGLIFAALPSPRDQARANHNELIDTFQQKILPKYYL